MIIQQDNFNRADALGSGLGLGPAWTLVFGGPWATNGFGISSNTAVPDSFGSDKLSLYTRISWPNDQYVQCRITVTGTSGDTGFGVALRSSIDGANLYRCVVNKATTNNVVVAKAVANAYTALQRYTVTWADGDTFRMEVQGTTLTAYQNGVALSPTVSDSSMTGGYAGILLSSAVTSGSIDDWEAGDFSTVPFEPRHALNEAAVAGFAGPF